MTFKGFIYAGVVKENEIRWVMNHNLWGQQRSWFIYLQLADELWFIIYKIEH